MIDKDPEGNMSNFSHLDERGQPHMVDVTNKPDTVRVARARGRILLKPETMKMLRDNSTPKGDALTTARLAGIMAAKKTAELIPLCHSIPLLKVNVELVLVETGVAITASATSIAKTGVEMEAMTAVSVAALTVYDMVKAVDRGAVITDMEVEYKSGGASGAYSVEGPKE